MSGGEQKQLEVGRALLLRPRVLLIDEPSIGLSPKLVQEVMTLLRQLADGGVTMLMVEQNVRTALKYANRALVLEMGRLALDRPASELLHDPDLNRLFLGGHAKTTTAHDACERRTKVGILGAGPAGLMLSHLLHRAGIDSVVLEARDRDYVEHRVRAGVLEQGTVDLLDASPASASACIARASSITASSCASEARGHRIDFPSLTGGRSIMVYGQQEVVKDLIRARLADAGTILFEVTTC